MSDEKYDSREDTKKHIKMVGVLLEMMVGRLVSRATHHDASKLLDPEKAIFDEVTPALKGLTYGSDEYKEQLVKMGDALKHHYENNRHHPEHFPNGVKGMTLVDLMEMFCDWCAATQRHDDGDILKSIKHNKDRFELGDVLSSILKNTALEYGMGKGSGHEREPR